MAAELNRLTHKIAIQLHRVVENCTICSSRSRRPVRKLLDRSSYTVILYLLPCSYVMTCHWSRGYLSVITQSTGTTFKWQNGRVVNVDTTVPPSWLG